ncbi:MAG: hypothetical protein HQL91_12800 [Magnetococcales bacterium]|nr:hypothetical protein [Magnetococcales bacterium]
MGHLQIRHLDDTVIERLLLRADTLGIPVEQLVRDLLTAEVQGMADAAPAGDADSEE